VADRLVSILNAYGTPTLARFTDTPQPNGSAVGNALEVLEAIAVMGGGTGVDWDSRGLAEQRHLVLFFFSELMSAEFGGYAAQWYRRASDSFESGGVLRAFLDLLGVHGVAREVQESLTQAPASILLPPGQPIAVPSHHSGVLCEVDQPRLGDFVNFTLGAGGNPYTGEFTPRNGVRVTKRLGDSVALGDVLCWVYADPSVAFLAKEVEAAFHVSDSATFRKGNSTIGPQML
jgi:thymidine phosphorylase